MRLRPRRSSFMRVPSLTVPRPWRSTCVKRASRRRLSIIPMPRPASRSRSLPPCGTSAVVSSLGAKTRSSPWAGEQPPTWQASLLPRGYGVSPSSTFRRRCSPWLTQPLVVRRESTHPSERTSSVRSIRQPPWLPIWIFLRACPHPTWRLVQLRSSSAVSSRTRRSCASSMRRNRASFCDRTARRSLRSPPALSPSRPASCRPI